LLGHRVLGWCVDIDKVATQYDVLHVHDPQVGALTISISVAARNVPALLSEHGGFNHTANALWAKKLHSRFTAPMLLKRYARVLASSESDFRQFSRLAPNTCLVENGVQTRKMISGDTDRIDLHRWIFWGRLSVNKQIHSVIKLVSSLADEGIFVDFLICGNDFDGILPSLKDQVAALNLQNQIHFRSNLSEAELRTEAETRGVFVLPSSYEGFGLSLIEAMAAGLMVFCRDIAPMNDVARDIALFLAFDGSDRDVQTVNALLSTPADDIEARRARGVMRANTYDWDAKVPAFLSQYEQCLEGR
jgi:alpha-1,3-mannosyltransferase